MMIFLYDVIRNLHFTFPVGTGWLLQLQALLSTPV
jgi:hypothetical protein